MYALGNGWVALGNYKVDKPFPSYDCPGRLKLRVCYPCVPKSEVRTEQEVKGGKEKRSCLDIYNMSNVDDRKKKVNKYIKNDSAGFVGQGLHFGHRKQAEAVAPRCNRPCNSCCPVLSCPSEESSARLFLESISQRQYEAHCLLAINLF